MRSARIGEDEVGQRGTHGSSHIERRVGDSIVPCIGEVSASVVLLLELEAELYGMATLNPRHVINESVYRSDADEITEVVGRLEYEAEPSAVSDQVAALSECLSGQAVAEIVDQIAAYGPCMTHRETHGMVPLRGGLRIGVTWNFCVVVVNNVSANKQGLV